MNCDKCTLDPAQYVPPLGERGAKYFLIGEAPGAEEVKVGIPFVGSAGKYLEKLLAMAGITWEDVYVTNVCKCRPTRNKTPNKKERECCVEGLWQELADVKPDVVITLGAVPLSMFGNYKLRDVHGTAMWRDFSGLPEDPDGFWLVSMYHPAAVLHKPGLKRTVERDFQMLPNMMVDKRVVPTDYAVLTPDHEVVGSPMTQVPKAGDILAVDTEVLDGKMVCMSASWEEGKGLCAPTLRLPPKDMMDVTYIFHNAKYDLKVLKKEGVIRDHRDIKWVDTMLAAYALGYPQVGLKYLGRSLLGLEMQQFGEVCDDTVSLMRYCCADSDATRRLWLLLHDGLPDFYWQIDLPLCGVLIDMEERGARIDRDLALRLRDRLDAEIDEIEIPFNPMSYQQVGAYIMDYLGIRLTKKTDTGGYSTEKDILTAIDDPTIQDVLRYRDLNKSLQTYVRHYIDNVDESGRLHPDFIQIRQPNMEDRSKDEGTRTGRLACARPNLQNVTKPDEEAPEGTIFLMDLFIPGEGKSFVSVDYEQIELRTTAILANEPLLWEVFEKGLDVHWDTCDRLGWPRTDRNRRKAKVLNFGCIFSGGSEVLGVNQMGMSFEESSDMMHGYMDQYKGVKRYIKEQKQLAHRDRQVTNWFGRTTVIDEMFSGDRKLEAHGERVAIATPIQGTAAEIVKMGMIRFGGEPMVLQVHDEILFEVDERYAVEFAHYVKREVLDVIEIEGMQFPVKAKVGPRWSQVAQV